MERSRARTITGLLTGATFACILALPAIDSVVRLDTTPLPQEKRQLAEKPGTPRSLLALEQLPAAFDAYFGDHFGFRSFLVRLEARATVLWLGVAPSPQVDVMVGRTGWLFFTGDKSVSYVEGTNPFSEAELVAWRTTLRQRNAWLARRGIRYLVVFAPGSPSIYPEYLPRWVRPSRHGTRLDQLMEAVKSCPEVPVLDLRPQLLDVKRLGVVYWRTDTHWNTFGAFVAYGAIMKSIARWFPEAQPFPFASFNVAWGQTPGGDLAAMAGIQGLVSERVPLMAPKWGFQARTLQSSDYATLRAWPRLEEPVITVRDHAPIPRLVMFRDSFSMMVAPFLSEHFGRAVYLWIQDFEPSVIERERPDVVIQEYTERLLAFVSPANPPTLAAE